MSGVGAKRWAIQALFAEARRCVSSVFDSTVYSGGVSSSSSKTAFSAGSSQHGKQRRADTDSNWVSRMPSTADAVPVSLRYRPIMSPLRRPW